MQLKSRFTRIFQNYPATNRNSPGQNAPPGLSAGAAPRARAPARGVGATGSWGKTRGRTPRGGSAVAGTQFRADLRVAKLLGANLADADLRQADLNGADLDKANLAGANFQGAIWTTGSYCGPSPLGECWFGRPPL